MSKSNARCWFGLFSLSLGGILGAGSASAQALEAVLASMLDGISEGNRAQVVEAVCLEARTAETLGRMAALELVADAQEPALVEAYQDEYLAALDEKFAPLAGTDSEALVLDQARIEDASKEGLQAQGVLGVTDPVSAMAYDIPVFRLLDGRWCLDPVAVQTD